jgi:hypothetical protein
MFGTKGMRFTSWYLISQSFCVLHKKNMTQHSNKNKNLLMNLSFEQGKHHI